MAYRREECGRALSGERCKVGVGCRVDEVGEKTEPEAVGGSGNDFEKAGELGVRSGAGRSCPVPKEGHARTNGACLAGSDRQTARTLMVELAAACSICHSWAKLLVGGDGVKWRGVRTDVSQIRSLLVWEPSGS